MCFKINIFLLVFQEKKKVSVNLESYSQVKEPGIEKIKHSKEKHQLHLSSLWKCGQTIQSHALNKRLRLVSADLFPVPWWDSHTKHIFCRLYSKSFITPVGSTWQLGEKQNLQFFPVIELRKQICKLFPLKAKVFRRIQTNKGRNWIFISKGSCLLRGSGDRRCFCLDGCKEKLVFFLWHKKKTSFSNFTFLV